MTTDSARLLRSACLLAGAALGAAAARADVTIEQKVTLDVASVIRAHGSTTTNITADKQREDTESHCEGMLSLVCGNVRGGEIVRLDRGLTWHLQPDKKSYREDIFATPEELAQMRAKMQARLDKMRSCPVAQRQQPIDKSKCEMSPPKIDVRKTDETALIAGHDTQRTVATLTETCTNRDTGDVCDTVVAVDIWLTQDKLAGAGDRRAFAQAYARKLGLTDPQGALSGEFAKYLAPYQSQIKQLTDKSSDFKGEPLKTSLRVMIGGAQCGAAAKAKTDGPASADGSPGGAIPNTVANVAQAGKAIGSALGGLFHKKKADAAAPPDAAAAGTPPASAASASASAPALAPGSATAPSDPYAQFVQLAALTTETVAVTTDAVPAGRFDVPPDWKKEVPKPSKQGDDDFTCPKSGN